ncbi:MAG: SIMPL domain-containing protein [Haloarculaceae archaeon]
MQRRELLVGTAAVGATALSGCLGTQATGSGSTTDTITVTGSAEKRAAPDRAVVEVSVEATGSSATAVRDELATQSEQLTQALLSSGIAEDQITTDQFSIRERREPPREGEKPAQPVYYGTHSFTIDIDNVNQVGSVIDTAIGGGADSVDRIEYTLSESKRTDLRQQALETAVSNARSEAELLAAQVDSRIVDVRQVTTSGGGVSPRFVETAAALDSGGSTELQPGDVTVSAQVEVVYEIN